MSISFSAIVKVFACISLFILIDYAYAIYSELKIDKNHYENGLNTGDWTGALAEWEKIPEASIYTKKYKQYEDIPFAKPTGDIIHLTNYTHAHDPTWQELLDFLGEDNTDDIPYDINSFVCTGFAETLHNSAEKAGIRAGFVTIDFPEPPGHAINVFNTTDKGLIYVDNTGPGDTEYRDTFISQSKCEWDKIGYINEGQEYGNISINYKDIDPTSYNSYQEYKGLWEDVENEYLLAGDKIDNYYERSDEYSKNLAEHQKAQQEYTNEVEKYNNELEDSQNQVEAGYQSKRSDLQQKFDAWENRKSTLEQDVQTYNETGKGIPDELQSRIDQLNQDLEDLKEEEKSLNDDYKNDVENAKKKFNNRAKELDQIKESLDQTSASLTTELAELNKLKNTFNANLKSLTDQEEYLGICYWKPHPEVVKSQIYW